LEQVAAATAAPGGGSAGAYAGALAAALTEMVSGLTIGKAKYEKVEPEMLAIRTQAAQLRSELGQAVEDDAAAFEAVMGAFRLPKDTEAEKSSRKAAVQVASLNAAHVPLHTAEDAVQVIELAARCARDGNLNAISDSLSAATLAHASMTAAAYNVRINLQGLDDAAAASKMLSQLEALEKRAETFMNEARAAMRARAKVG
jgi:glutamate formiminotransferase/formiminotetrahydrofolate cyclodeaminase